jgi:flagellar biosynthesis/type III secretory pathway chaperone
MQSTERLAELVRSKHQVLVQLREVGRQQTDLVSRGDIASLLTLLAAKQQLIGSLQALEQELAAYFRQDPGHRVWPSPQARSNCAQLAEACNELLEEIVRLEKLGAEKMTARRNEVAEQLQQVHTAAHVRTAYETHRRSNVS